MGYREELAALIESTEKSKQKQTVKKPEKKKSFSINIKTLLFFLLLAPSLLWAYFYFFNGKSEEDLIREQFHAVAELLRKEKKEGVIVATANMQKLGGYFSPVTHVSIEELSWMNGDLDREGVIRHAFRGKSMFEKLKIDFTLHELGIRGNNAAILFTVTLSGVLRNGDRITEARELETIMNKDNGKWLFQSLRVNELIKK